jgi:hypothetical protein
VAASLPDQVRAHCAAVAASAHSVSIDHDALERLELDVPEGGPQLDPVRHFLEGSEEDVAAYLLALDAINFGSGWFPTLAKRRTVDGRSVSGYFTTAWNLADHVRAHGPWGPAELRRLRTEEVAGILGQAPDHELMALYAQALRQLGSWLGERTALDVVREAGGSATALSAELARMAMWHDVGYFKRAQIVPSDLALAGVADFRDLHALTIFADNLVPHVLRCEGVLVYDRPLAEHVDAGQVLPAGPWEREIRACAVHACALLAPRLGLTEHELDHVLWNRGQEPAFKARPRHRCRTVFY